MTTMKELADLISEDLWYWRKDSTGAIYLKKYNFIVDTELSEKPIKLIEVDWEEQKIIVNFE